MFGWSSLAAWWSSFKKTEWRSVYPMDYYAKAGGTYANYAPETERAALQQ